MPIGRGKEKKANQNSFVSIRKAGSCILIGQINLRHTVGFQRRQFDVDYAEDLQILSKIGSNSFSRYDGNVSLLTAAAVVIVIVVCLLWVSSLCAAILL